MTRAERLKLAKAARELASDFAEGHGPKLTPHSFCGCAAGETVKRSGIDLDSPRFVSPMGTALEEVASGLDQLVGTSLTKATFMQSDVSYFADGLRSPVPGAVVFPLLWLADELESA